MEEVRLFATALLVGWPSALCVAWDRGERAEMGRDAGQAAERKGGTERDSVGQSEEGLHPGTERV